MKIISGKIFWITFCITLLWSGVTLLCNLYPAVFFTPLYSFSGICCAVLILFIVPSIALFRLLNLRLQFSPMNSLLLAPPLSVAVTSLAILWISYFFHFSLSVVYPFLFILSLITYLFMGRSAETQRSCSCEATPALSTIEGLIFGGLLLIFAITVCFPWALEGTLTSKGVSVISMGDYAMTYGYTASLLTTGIPPMNSFFASEPMRYYYLMNVYTASLVKLSMGGLTIQSATAVTSFIIGIIFYLGFFAIARSVLNDFRAALFALLLVTYVDRFDIVPTILCRVIRGSWPIQVDDWLYWAYFRFPDNWVCIHWIPTHLLGTLFLFLFLYIFFCGKLSLSSMIMGTVCLASVMGFATFAAVGAAGAIALFFIIEAVTLIVRRGSWEAWRLLLGGIIKVACMAGIALLLCWPILKAYLSASLPGGSVVHSVRWPPLHYQFVEGYTPPNFMSYVLQLILVEFVDLGPVALLGIIGMLLWRRWGDRVSLTITFSLVCASLFIATFVWMKGPIQGNSSSKVVGISLVWGLALFSGLCFRERKRVLEFIRGLGWSASSQRYLGIAAKGIFWICMLIGLAGTMYALNARWAIAMHIPDDEYRGLLFVRESLPLVAVVQRSPYIEMNFIPGWGGRRTAVANEWQGVQCAVDPQRVRTMCETIDSAYKILDPVEAHRIMQKNRVDYIFIGGYERTRYGEKALKKFEENPALFKPVWRKGEVVIYQIVRDLSRGD